MKAIINIENKTYTQFPDLIRNDFGYDITFNLKQNDNTNFVLAENDIVKFKTRLYGEDNNKIDDECVITNNTSGTVVYNIKETDLNTSGRYECEIEVSSDIRIVSAKLGYLTIIDDL
jgi:hypothetical protein